MYAGCVCVYTFIIALVELPYDTVLYITLGVLHYGPVLNMLFNNQIMSTNYFLIYY